MPAKKNNKIAKKSVKKVSKVLKMPVKSSKVGVKHEIRPKLKGVKAKKLLSAKQETRKIKMASVKRAQSAKSRKMMALKLEEQARHDRHLEEIKKVGELVSNKNLSTTVGSSVGAGAMDVLKLLVEGPKTDENIAEKLGVKVNDVRRMLNMMNSYSIVRYDVNKDSKGWLIFTWRIDSEKLSEYVEMVSKEVVAPEAVLPGNCNDFFMCRGCYNKEKTVLPFDTAFESDFTCGSCGKPYALLTRQETVALFKSSQ